MTTLTVTARQHPGVQLGQRIEIGLLPGGQAQSIAAAAKRNFRDLHGLLEDRTNGRVLTLEELSDAIAAAGAEAGRG